MEKKRTLDNIEEKRDLDSKYQKRTLDNNRAKGGLNDGNPNADRTPAGNTHNSNGASQTKTNREES
jgi:hypothetical protein